MDSKCSECARVITTHADGSSNADGCAHIECPVRKNVMHDPGVNGAQGSPGSLAEEKPLVLKKPLVTNPMASWLWET